jgi:hypothetical protein
MKKLSEITKDYDSMENVRISPDKRGTATKSLTDIRKKMTPGQSQAVTEITGQQYQDNEGHIELEHRLGKHYLEKDQGDAVMRYKGGSKIVNQTLWHSHKGTLTVHDNNDEWQDISKGHIEKDRHERVQKDIGQMDANLASHKTPESFHVYSGTPHDPRKIMNSEGIVHHPAYLSTSTRHSVADSFATKRFNDDFHSRMDNHVMKINVPKDHPGMYVGHNNSMGGEHEFILPRGTNLKHVKTETNSRLHGNGVDTVHDHVHHMEIVK